MKKLFTIKKAILLLTVVLSGITSMNAQTVIKVGSVADSIAGTAGFSLIKSAYKSLPATITGAYLIELEATYDPTREAYPITLAAVTGASATNTVTIKPATGISPITITAPKVSLDLTSTSVSGNIGNGYAIVYLANTTYPVATAPVSGLGIPAGTTVSTVTAAASITLSANATQTSNAPLYFGASGGSAFTTSSTTSTAVTTAGALVSVANASLVSVGQLVSGAGVGNGVFVTATDNVNNTVTLSANVTVANGATLVFITPLATTTSAAASTASTSLSVSSATGLAVGQVIAGAGIAAGTTITVISGTTLTLSAAATVANGANLYSGVFCTPASVTAQQRYIDVNDASSVVAANAIMFSTSSVNALTVTSKATNTLFISAGATVALNSTVIVSQVATRQNTFVISGSYITIDGGSKANLIIQNSNRYVANAIYITGTFNTITNCMVQGAEIQGPSNTNNGTLLITGASNKVLNCDIFDMDGGIPSKMPVVGVYINANSNTVAGCNIYNFQGNIAGNTTGGVYVAGGSYTIIRKNKFYWTNSMQIPSAVGTAYAIAIGGSPAGPNVIADNVIDGSISGGAYTFKTDNGGSAAITYKCIYGKNTYFRNNVIQNMSGYCNTFYGIHVNNLSTAGLVADSICNGNTINNISLLNSAAPTFYGAQFDATSSIAANFKNNTVSNVTLTPQSAVVATLYGIQSSGTGSSSVLDNYSGNSIYNLIAGNVNYAAANTCVALNPAANTGVIEKSLIYNLSVPGGTNASTVYGIKTVGGNALAQTYNTIASTGTLLKNNIVRLGNEVGEDVSVYGIYQGALTAVTNAFATYNNSVYVGGTAPNTAAKNTFDFYTAQVTTVTGTNVVKNNIFANQRGFVTGGTPTAVNYAVAIPTAITSVVTASDYNLYFASAVGLLNATTKTAIGDWQGSVGTLSDSHSNSADPKFSAVTGTTAPDMHLTAGTPADATGADLSTSVADDYFGSARSTLSPNDLGAVAYYITTAAAQINNEQNTLVYGKQAAIVIENMSGKTASIYALSGQMVKSILLTSDKVSVNSATGFYIVKVGNQNTKVLVK